MIGVHQAECQEGEGYKDRQLHRSAERCPLRPVRSQVSTDRCENARKLREAGEKHYTGAAVAHPDTHKQPGIVGFSHQPERKKLIIHRHWTERLNQMKTYLQTKNYTQIL